MSTDALPDWMFDVTQPGSIDPAKLAAHIGPIARRDLIANGYPAALVSGLPDMAAAQLSIEHTNRFLGIA